MKRKKTPQEEYQTELDELTKSFNRWHEIYQYGANDPSWPDGVNLNLVHNHILYHGKRIAELASKHGFQLPAAFDLPFPPEVDQDYMARREEIRANAKLSLRAYEGDPNFSRIAEVSSSLDNTQKARIASNILSYVSSLRDAIQRSDYLLMRRHEKSELYLQSAKTFVDELKEEDLRAQFSLEDYQEEDEMEM